MRDIIYGGPLKKNIDTKFEEKYGIHYLLSREITI